MKSHYKDCHLKSSTVIQQFKNSLASARFGARRILMPALALALCGSAMAQSDSAPGPMRGFYQWRGQYVVPQAAGAQDSYDRFEWSSLETSEGVYDFSALDSLVNAAKVNRQKCGFRIRCCVAGAGVSVPAYLQAEMPNGFYDSGTGTYVPDWNSPAFISHMQKLIAAIGTRYDGNPALGFVDIGMYGDWGEWHVAEFNYAGNPQAQPATLATEEKIIDAHYKAFPREQLLMLTAEPNGLQYALQLSQKIGLRMDDLGQSWFGDQFNDMSFYSSLVENRWKTAPTVTEFDNPNPSGFTSLAVQQAAQYHVAMVGNGNINSSWSNLSSSQKTDLENLGATVGYNFQWTNPKVQHLTTGTYGVYYDLQNIGVTPAYEPWQITIVIKNAANTIMGTLPLTTNLETLLPSSTATLKGGKVIMKSDLAPGDYTVNVEVTDPSGYLDPMPLNGLVSNGDGSYQLTTIQVQTSAG